MSFKSTFLIVLFLISFACLSQETILLEQNPPSVKWRQINTPSFKIIFPKDFEKEAQRMANTMQHLYGPVSKSMGVKPRKLSLVLQNQNSISNGFVTVAPRRSEFFTMPPQDYNFLGTNDWLNLLAVHEFRHVVQYQKTLTGFTRAMQLVFGGDIWSFISFVGAPSWFWEGDAVAIETALTPSGRGRIPYFDLAFRTTLMERGPWTYHKQYLGSFKDYVPNYYVTGYHMVTHVRRVYGEQAWSNIFERTFNNPYIPFNFSRSIKKETGYSLIKTYRNMTREVDSLWRWQIDQLNTTESNKALFRKNVVFTNYDYPQFLSDGRIVALRSGLSNISQFVFIDSSTTAKKIYTPGIINDAGMLSMGGDKMVWNEFFFDPRFAVRTYSVIKVYDFKTQSSKTITKRSRLSGSAISPDGNKIVSIENATSSDNSIVIHDIMSRKEISRINSPENYFFAMPRWSSDGKSIVVLKNTPKGKTITQYSTDGKLGKDLLPISFENVGHPIQHENYLLYNSPSSGIDNIYALNIETGERFQVTSKLYGAYNPAVSPDGKTLAFNNFTKYGMDVETMPFDPASWIPTKEVEDRNVRYYEPVVEQEGNPEILTSIPNNNFEVRKYRQAFNLFNPYSLSIIPGSTEIGLRVHSQNVLSTAYSALGITFNGNERRPYAFANLSYQGLWPIIDIKGGIGTRAINLDKDQKNVRDSIYTWTEKSVGLGVRIPLNLTKNKYLKSLNIGVNTALTYISDYTVPENYILEQGKGVLHSAQYSISYSSLLKPAKRDVTYRFGFSGFIEYNHTPFKVDYEGALVAAEGKIYLPGFVKHHGLQIRAGYLEQGINSNYSFISPILFPRGYGYTVYSTFYNGSLEYKLPIWNADAALGSILNIQRFKAKAFYDIGIGDTGNVNTYFNSLGLELHMDFNLLRWIPLLEAGVRWTYVPEFKDSRIDLLFFQFNAF